MRRASAIGDDEPSFPKVSLDTLDLAGVALPEVRPLASRIPQSFRVEEEAPTVVAEKLEELVPLALSKWEEILREPTDFNNIKLTNAQLDAAHKVISTQMKVDEGRFRRRQNDTLSKLLDVIREEEGRIGGGTAAVIAGALAA